jgi:hypothetical protein
VEIRFARQLAVIDRNLMTAYLVIR